VSVNGNQIEEEEKKTASVRTRSEAADSDGVKMGNAKSVLAS
jgi:hypothetical protein